MRLLGLYFIFQRIFGLLEKYFSDIFVENSAPENVFPNFNMLLA